MANADAKPKKDLYFYVKTQHLKEKVLRGLEEDEHPTEKKEIQMPLGPGRYIPYTDRRSLWHKPITMAQIIESNDEQKLSKADMSFLDSSANTLGDKKKQQLSADDRAEALFQEAAEAHPRKKVFTRTNKGHGRETIPLPTIQMRKTMDDLCPSDEEDTEKELASTIPVNMDGEGFVPGSEAEKSSKRVTTDTGTLGNMSKFSSRLQSQIAHSSVAEYAKDEEQLELIMEHRIKIKTEVPMPYKLLLHEETLPVLRTTVKAYRDILRKDNDLRIEAEEYLKKLEKKTKQFAKIKRHTAAPR